MEQEGKEEKKKGKKEGSKCVHIFQNSSCLNKNEFLGNSELKGKKRKKERKITYLNPLIKDEPQIESRHSQVFDFVIFISHNHCGDSEFYQFCSNNMYASTLKSRYISNPKSPNTESTNLLFLNYIRRVQFST